MSLNPLDIYARAARRLKLTPGERALLKTADTLLIAGLAGGFVAVAQALLDGGQPLSLGTLGHVFLYAAATALLTGVAKLFRASGDAVFTAIGNSINGLTGVESRLPQPPQSQAQPPTSASAFMARQQPLSSRLGIQGVSRPGSAGGSFPPLMPDSQAERMASLQRAAVQSDPRSDPSTQPIRAASASVSGPRTPVPAPPPSTPVASAQATPAPSQAQTQQSAVAADGADDGGDDENGPRTIETPAVTAAREDTWAR